MVQIPSQVAHEYPPLGATSVCLVGENRRAPSRHCRDARVYGQRLRPCVMLSTPPLPPHAPRGAKAHHLLRPLGERPQGLAPGVSHPADAPPARRFQPPAPPPRLEVCGIPNRHKRGRAEKKKNECHYSTRYYIGLRPLESRNKKLYNNEYQVVDTPWCYQPSTGREQGEGPAVGCEKDHATHVPYDFVRCN